MLGNNDIKFVDTLPRFNRYLNSSSKSHEYLFHTYDTNHPNEKGHKLIAKELFKKLNIYIDNNFDNEKN